MIVPTMTLEEIYEATYADYDFLFRKLLEFSKDFRRRALKATAFPYKRKYIFKSYKSNIEYTIYLRCFKRRQWDNPMFTVVTSYAHESGTTSLVIGMDERRILSVFTAHFWSRFRERYINDNNRTIQETMELFFLNTSIQGVAEGVMRNNADKDKPNSNIEYYAVTNSLGVCFCEKKKDNDKIEVYNTYLPLHMLTDEQHKKVIPLYIAAYFRDYAIQNPNEKPKIDQLIDDWCDRGDKENWSIQRFIKEGEKLMDEYPLYLM